MRLSIGIVTWNRSGLLRQTLASLLAMKVPPGVECEMIVCDNNSTDDTAAVVKSFQGSSGLQYVLERRQGICYARNAVADAATGEWVLFADDDIQFSPEYLPGYLEGIQRYPDAVVFGGPVRPWIGFEPTHRDRFLIENFPWVHAVLLLDKDREIFADSYQLPHGPNMAFRADVVRKFRFDTVMGMVGSRRKMGEETDLARRVLSSAGRGWLLAAPGVNHYIPRQRAGLGHFLRWHKATGLDRMHSAGPLARGPKGGRLWVWRLIAKRLAQAATHYPRQRKVAYELLGEAASLRGHLQATLEAEAGR